MMRGKTKVMLEVEGWATPAPGITLDALIEEMKALGNSVLEVDRENGRLKVLHAKGVGMTILN